MIASLIEVLVGVGCFGLVFPFVRLVDDTFLPRFCGERARFLVFLGFRVMSSIQYSHR